MIFCAGLSAWQWSRRPIYRLLAPAYGLVSGIWWAVYWRASGTSFLDTISGIAAFFVLGWIFWLIVKLSFGKKI